MKRRLLAALAAYRAGDTLVVTMRDRLLRSIPDARVHRRRTGHWRVNSNRWLNQRPSGPRSADCFGPPPQN